MQQNIKNFLRIVPIKSFEDNYAYLIFGSKKNQGTLVDPADTSVIIPFLEKYKNLNITHVLYTHKHWDHAGNGEELKKFLVEKQNLNYKEEIKFIAQKEDALEISVVNQVLNNKQNNFEINGATFQSFHAPCHTKGHALYYFDTEQNNFKDELSQDETNILEENVNFQITKGIFTGDTLFLGGAGRFFEGQADQMILNMDYIGSLPEETQILCGHEYTKSNYEWARQVEINNQELYQVYQKTYNLSMTIPGNIKTEKQTNLFMRSRVEALQKLLGIFDNNAVETLTLLRQMKNDGKGLKDIQKSMF